MTATEQILFVESTKAEVAQKFGYFLDAEHQDRLAKILIEKKLLSIIDEVIEPEAEDIPEGFLQFTEVVLA